MRLANNDRRSLVGCQWKADGDDDGVFFRTNRDLPGTLTMKLKTLAVVAVGWIVLGIQPVSAGAQDSGPSERGVRLIAEWEPAIGTMIAWPLKVPEELVRDLAADDQLFVLVQPSGLETARKGIGSLGLSADRVRFVGCSVESGWPRDWGPHQVLDAESRMLLVDHRFAGYPWYPIAGGKPERIYRTGPGDDLVSAEFAAALQLPRLEVPAVLTGGNFLTDGHGTAFCTRALVDENNPALDEKKLRQLVAEKLGIDRLVVLENTEQAGIQHLDCWLKVLDPERLLVKRPPGGHPEEAAIDRNLAVLSSLRNVYGRPYEILRIDCPEVPVAGLGRETRPIAAYTNSLILNHRVFVPLFGVPGDVRALETWRMALPGFEVKGYLWDQWMDFDALHCRTRALFDPQMMRVEHPRLTGEVPCSAGGHAVAVTIEDRSRAGLDLDQCRVWFRIQGDDRWSSAPLLPQQTKNSFCGVIPSFAAGTEIEYYLVVCTQAGKKAHRPAGAPAAVHRFRVKPEDGPRIDGSRTGGNPR